MCIFALIFREVSFLTGKENAFVSKLKHRSRPLHVRGLHVDFLLFERESNVLDETSNDVVARFDAEFIWHVCKMIEQRSKIDPFAAGLEDLVDELDKVQDVVGAVDEETGDDAVL